MATKKPTAKQTTKATTTTEKKVTTPKVRYAHYRIFDRTPNGGRLIEKPKIAVNEQGLIAPEELKALKKQDAIRNRVVHCENELAFTNLFPSSDGRNIVMTAEVVALVFSLAVEEGYEPASIPFQLFARKGIEVSGDAVKNVLRGKTRRDVEVPGKLREKYAAKVAAAPTNNKVGKTGATTEFKVQTIFRIAHGDSGRIAGKGAVTSSTANGWWRQFMGRYRDGSEIPTSELPDWVADARTLAKEKIESGEITSTSAIDELLGLNQ